MSNLSKIEICNLALASIGADSIRSFDENNKRARMCDVFFDSTRDYLLSKFDWNFARKLEKLNMVVDDTLVIPEGYFAYQLPYDCKTPIELLPEGSRDKWFINGDKLYCQFDSREQDVVLAYTAKEVNPYMFTDTFANVLALGLAARLAPALTQDPTLTKTLYNQYQIELQEVMTDDANVGNVNRKYDETPDNDTFVYPDGYVDVFEDECLWR
jgi:hypothetical protein